VILRGTDLVPLTHSVSSTFLEQLLVVRNAVFAVDEAVVEILLAIAFRRRNEAIPGSTASFHHNPRDTRNDWKGEL
jgi:hypothetical protein